MTATEISSTTGDAYARCQFAGSTAGRGAIAGWTPCPLCYTPPSSDSSKSPGFTVNDALHDDDTSILENLAALQKMTKSVKLFSHGRGLAAHLHAVHTPWNPGKVELKRRAVLKRQEENRRKRRMNCPDESTFEESCCGDQSVEQLNGKRMKLSRDGSSSETLATKSSSKVPSDFVTKTKRNLDEKWNPTEEEINQWNQRVMKIVSLVELHGNGEDRHCVNEEPSTNRAIHSSSCAIDTNNSGPTKGRDRLGKICPAYRESLPPLLSAAADGDLKSLKKCLKFDDRKESSKYWESLDRQEKRRIKSLVSMTDRNGSTAEHWAAGGGHVDCLSYLLEVRDLIGSDNTDEGVMCTVNKETNKKIRRRRDGKTSLHYAARNGHNNCIDLLLSRGDVSTVDIPSGDGTTPLHMACYGGHPSTVRHLIESHQADVHALNEWNCGVTHWAAMSLGDEGEQAVIDLCNYLKKRCNVDFVARQRQGHTPLHKAASRKNRHLVEWLAGEKVAQTDAKDKKNEESESAIAGRVDVQSQFTNEERRSMGLPDDGGNRPSDIWLSVGGDEEFGFWMRDHMGW